MDKFSIGADPEFSCYHSGEYIRAYRLYPSCRINGGESLSFIFGYDGASETGEIRPAPAYEAEDFVNNVKKCLALGYRIIAHQKGYDKSEEKIDEFMKKIELRAGSYWSYPLGGHIHLGIRDFRKEFPSELEKCFLKQTQQEQIKRNDIYWKKEQVELWKYRFFIINTLDSIVGLGLKLLENWTRGQNRNRSYGFFSQFKEQPWGIEYRTPPSFIISPEITKAVFELVQLSLYNIVDKTEITTNLLTELQLIDIKQEWQELYRRESKDGFREKFRGNWLKAINSLDKLAETKNLNSMLDLIENKEEWNDEVNLFESWEINKSVFKSLEYIDPTNYYKNENRDYDDYDRSDEDDGLCPNCGSDDTEYDDNELVCNDCGYNEESRLNDTLVDQCANGTLGCPNCGSTNVRRQAEYCFQCNNEGCGHHICDFFMRRQ